MYDRNYYLKNKPRWERYAENAKSDKGRSIRRAISAKWRKNNPEKKKAQDKKTKIKNKDKINIQRYFKLLEMGKQYLLSPTKFIHALEGWKQLIRKRDNSICQICGIKAKIAHHLFHKSKYPGLALNLNNGMILCTEHHDEVHYRKVKVT